MKDSLLNDSIYWIGYVDWDVRNFHGYSTDKGSTYNAYLIKDKKNIVIDSVKAPYANEFLKNIKNYVEFDQIDYVVCNHAEPDHSGSIPELMKVCKNAELVCNEKCKNFLSMHYDTTKWKFKIIDEKQSISTGKYTLNFVNTPMAHWPESMATYIPEIGLLFSMDAFGQHLASSNRFDYQETISEVLYEAKKYYANIIMLYGKSVGNVLNKLKNIEIKMIAPSHGIIWKTHIDEILNSYHEWAICKSKAKVLIFFDSMWGSTTKMANAIYKGALQENVIVRKFDLKSTNITNIATEIIDSAVIGVGSSTLNKTILPKVAETLTYIKGLNPINKWGLAFGSYGWGKIGGQHVILEYFKEMKFNLISEDPIQARFVPTTDILQKCEEYGKKLASKALEYAQ